MKTRFCFLALHMWLFAGLTSAQVRLAEVPGRPGTFDKTTGVALTASSGIGYVSNPGSGLVQKFRLDTGEILKSVSLPAGVGPITLSPDERTLVVLGVTAQKLYGIDTESMAIRYETSYPGTTFTFRSNAVITREGYYFYISDPARNQVLVFQTRTGVFDHFVRVDLVFPGDHNPNLMSAIPETSRIAVLCTGKTATDQKSVWIFDSLLNNVVDSPVLPNASTESFNNVQATPGGDYFFVASYNNDRVFVYNLKSRSVGSYPSGGSGPAKIVASADGRYLAVVNVKSKNIALFDGIPVLSNPTTLDFQGFEPSSETLPAFSADNHILYIPLAGKNEIIAYDPGRRAVQKHILTAATPTRIVASADDKAVTSLDLGGNVLSLIVPDATAIYVPYLTQKAREYTGLAVANLGDSIAALSLTARDNSGNLIPGGLVPGTSNPKLISLSAGQQMSRVAGREVFGFDPSAEIDGYIEAYAVAPGIKLMYMSGNVDQTRLDGLVADSRLTKFLSFGRITQGISQFGSQTSTEIVLQNPSESEASVSLRLFGDSGSGTQEMLGYLETKIPAHARIRKSPSQLMPGVTQPIEHGYLELTSSLPLKGIEVVTMGDSIAYLPATMRDDPTTRFDAVQFASGGSGVLDTPIFSNLAVANMTDNPIKFTVEVLDQNGNIIPEDSSPVEMELKGFESIAGGAEEILDFPDPLKDPALYTGTLHIQAEQEGLTASLLYGDARNGKYLASSSLISQRGTKLAFVHFAEGRFDTASESEYYTGIGVYNPGSSTVPVAIEVYSPTGELLGKNSFSVEPLSRRAQTLGQIIQNLKRPSTGYIIVYSNTPVEAFEVFGSSRSELLVSVAPVVLTQ